MTTVGAWLTNIKGESNKTNMLVTKRVRVTSTTNLEAPQTYCPNLFCAPLFLELQMPWVNHQLGIQHAQNLYRTENITCWPCRHSESWKEPKSHVIVMSDCL